MIVRLIEVGPRDGFQPVAPFIPTDDKVGFIVDAHGAGLRHIEIGAFVSPTAVPQMRDTAEIMRRVAGLPGLDTRVLVPNARGAELALAAGARHLVYVVSVSDAHNRSNVGRGTDDSVADYRTIVSRLSRDVRVRINLSTSFDCPFDGRIHPDRVLRLIEQLLPGRSDIEIGLCDTTGRADPAAVEALAGACRERFGAKTRWVFHGHDTYGLGLVNIMAAFRAGIRDFDTAFGGLGGCPFAPGATGNTATEDAAWMFARMGIETGLDVDRLIDLATRAAALPGASTGGRARIAIAARRAA